MDLKRTPLYDFHIANGARMVPFAGWDMPVQYSAGIKAEHLATRNGAGLFDVSHMAQIEISGAGANAFLERLTPTNIRALYEGEVRYSLFLNDTGGVLDDLMIFHSRSPSWFVLRVWSPQEELKFWYKLGHFISPFTHCMRNSLPQAAEGDVQ